MSTFQSLWLSGQRLFCCTREVYNCGAVQKDFKRWHEKKSQVNSLPIRPFFHEREIWFCYLEANVGFEQDGNGEQFQRPVLILKKLNSSVFWAIPLTKAAKKRRRSTEKFYFNFTFIRGIESGAILSQLRRIDGRRLSWHIGTISERDFETLTEKLKALVP